MYTYKPSEVHVVAVGIPITGDYAADTFCTIKKTVPRYSLYVGANGDVCRVQSMNETAQMSLILMQSSYLNALLSGIVMGDRLLASGILPSTVKDMNGLSIHNFSKSWVIDDPEAGFAAGVGTRTWIIDTDFSMGVDGGALPR